MNFSVKFPKTSTWADFSDRLCKIFKLPAGSRFCLLDANGRKKRDDTVINRKYLRKSEIVGVTTGDSNLVSVFEIIKKLVSPKDLALGDLAAKGPKGEILNGNTKIKTWRQMTPTLSKESRLERHWIESEIRDEIAPIAKASIYSAEEGIEDPETKIPQAYLLALLDFYDKAAVLAACKYAGIVK
jgi:hypothetical protein